MSIDRNEIEAFILKQQGELKVNDVVHGFYPDTSEIEERIAALEGEVKILFKTKHELPRGNRADRDLLLNNIKVARNRKAGLKAKLARREQRVKDCFFALWVHGKVKYVYHYYDHDLGYWRKNIFTIEERRQQAINECKRDAESYRKHLKDDKENIFAAMSLGNTLDAIAVLENLEFTPYQENRFSLNVGGLWQAAIYHSYYIQSLFDIDCAVSCQRTLQRLYM